MIHSLNEKYKRDVKKFNFKKCLPDILLFASETFSSKKLAKVLTPISNRIEIFKSLDIIQPLSMRAGSMILISSDYYNNALFNHRIFLEARRIGLPIVIISDDFSDIDLSSSAEEGIADVILYRDFFNSNIEFHLQKSLSYYEFLKENCCLNNELHKSLKEVSNANNELQCMIKGLEKEARTDPLTGLANRRWSNLMLDSRWEEAKRHNVSLAFVMIDLDNFKPLNDFLGHQAGDDCLKLAAQIISSNCRKIDLASRFGGDEFGILMPHTSPEDAIQVGERIARAFSESVQQIFPEVSTSMSVGVSHLNISRPSTAKDLVAHADLAMYESKKKRNRVSLASYSNKAA